MTFPISALSVTIADTTYSNVHTHPMRNRSIVTISKHPSPRYLQLRESVASRRWDHRDILYQGLARAKADRYERSPFGLRNKLMIRARTKRDARQTNTACVNLPTVTLYIRLKTVGAMTRARACNNPVAPSTWPVRTGGTCLVSDDCNVGDPAPPKAATAPASIIHPPFCAVAYPM